MNFRVTHTTRYAYSAPVGLCWNKACLLPRETPTQKCRASEVHIVPDPDNLHERRDFFGNRVTYFSIQHQHEELVVTAKSEVAVSPDSDALQVAGRQDWTAVKERLANAGDASRLPALPFLYNSPLVHSSRALADYARPSFADRGSLLDAVQDLMQRIYTDFSYDPEVTTIATPLPDVLENRHGVCQDFAHIGVGCLRSMGLAARYVSGYIETLPAPGKERLVGADASHAWFSVYAGEAGWVDFDPTNNQIPSGQHITVAWGRDFSDVSPLRGIALGGGKHKVGVAVDVERRTTE